MLDQGSCNDTPPANAGVYHNIEHCDVVTKLLIGFQTVMWIMFLTEDVGADNVHDDAFQKFSKISSPILADQVARGLQGN